MKPISLLLPLLLLLSACAAPAPPASGLPQALASTDIIADVVRQVGGENIALQTLIPTGSDPHAFSPAPQDAATIARADVIFLNGLGLETALQPLLENARADALLVTLSQGLETAPESAALSQREAAPPLPPGGPADPHVWSDPNNVRAWLPLIVQALSQRDPQNAPLYQQRAAAYAAQLDALDAWIREQVAAIPPQRRILVSDHEVWGYFAARYGFTLQAALIPGYSTLAQPSARELAALEDAIRQAGVPAIFVGRTVNPSLAERVAADTGVRLVFLYTGSLSAPDGPAPTYLEWMRYNVTAIVNALK